MKQEITQNLWCLLKTCRHNSKSRNSSEDAQHFGMQTYASRQVRNVPDNNITQVLHFDVRVHWPCFVRASTLDLSSLFTFTLFPFYCDLLRSIAVICLFIQAPYVNFRFLYVVSGILYRIYTGSYCSAPSVVCIRTNTEVSFPTCTTNLFCLLRFVVAFIRQLITVVCIRTNTESRLLAYSIQQPSLKTI